MLTEIAMRSIPIIKDIDHYARDDVITASVKGLYCAGRWLLSFFGGVTKKPSPSEYALCSITIGSEQPSYARLQKILVSEGTESF